MLTKQYFLQKQIVNKTMYKLDKDYKYSAPSFSIVQQLFSEFRSGRSSTGGAERSIEDATPENIEENSLNVVSRSEIKRAREAIGSCLTGFCSVAVIAQN